MLETFPDPEPKKPEENICLQVSKPFIANGAQDGHEAIKKTAFCPQHPSFGSSNINFPRSTAFQWPRGAYSIVVTKPMSSLSQQKRDGYFNQSVDMSVAIELLTTFTLFSVVYFHNCYICMCKGCQEWWMLQHVNSMPLVSRTINSVVTDDQCDSCPVNWWTASSLLNDL